MRRTKRCKVLPKKGKVLHLLTKSRHHESADYLCHLTYTWMNLISDAQHANRLSSACNSETVGNLRCFYLTLQSVNVRIGTMDRSQVRATSIQNCMLADSNSFEAKERAFAKR